MPTPPLAFGFANLAMLGWLAAAAAPILIHLWMRQTHRETAWAAVRFLRAALEKQARRLRLQHWILLAVRTLLLVLVALAAAKPLVDSGWLGSAVPTHRVLVIDASLSMSSRSPGGDTALERAKRAAITLTERGRAGDSFSVLVMGASNWGASGRPTPDADVTRRAIDAITPGQGVADPLIALANASQQVEAAQAIGTAEQHEVVFFTDLGDNSWSRLAGDAGVTAYDTLAAIASVSVVDAGSARRANGAVTSISLGQGLPSLAAPVEVRAEARLFGGEPTERVAQLLIGDQVAAEKPITLTPGVAVPIDFVHAFRRPGPVGVSIRLAPVATDADPLAADDQRWLGLTLPERVSVLCVAGAPGACDYLADALDPTGESVLRPVVVSDADLPTVDFTDYACVFLSNVSELTTAEASRLRRYAELGGGVALLLGDRVRPTRYNETLGPSLNQLGGTPRLGEVLRRVAIDDRTAETPLLPGRLSPSVTTSSFRLDPLDYEHPIAQPFRGQERAGLLTTPVGRHFPLELTDGTGVSVALALENGDPLLVTAEIGRGRVAVLTTAASLDSVDPATGEPWTALPAWPSFLPIVRGMVLHLAAAGGGAQTLRVGDTLDGIAGSARESVVISSPRGQKTVVVPDAEDAWSHGPLSYGGVYLIGPEGGPPTSAVAVNADPAESDPARVDTATLPSTLTIRRGPSEAIDGTSAASPLHRWLLLGALVLALVEPALACWFGRRDA